MSGQLKRGIRETFRLMTYNVHGCIGSDGRLDVDRVGSVIAEQHPDLVVLQEIDVGQQRSGRVDQAQQLADALSMHAHFTCASQRGGGEFGIAMLASQEISLRAEGCLPAHGDEARAAQWACVSRDGVDMDVLHTHLSVRYRDRKAQLKALLGDEWLATRMASPHLIVCGDLNAMPFSSVYRTLSRKLNDVQRALGGRNYATWPATRPFARIDHIFVGSGFSVERCLVPRSPLTMAASDHLPVVADLKVHTQ